MQKKTLSVVTPWRREDDFHGRKGAELPGRGGPKARRASLIAAFCLVFGLAYALWDFWILGYFKSPKLIPIGEVTAKGILDAYGNVTLLRVEGQAITVLSIPESTEDRQSSAIQGSTAVILTPGKEPVIASVTGRELTSAGIGAQKTIKVLNEKEKLLPVRGYPLFLTFEPERGLVYGTAWLLSAYDQEGQSLWHVSISTVPFLAAADQSITVVGSMDVASSAVCQMHFLDTRTGSVVASRTLGEGFWRDVYLLSDRVIAVLDQKIITLSRNGAVLWEARLQRPVAASCLGQKGPVVASTAERGVWPVSFLSRATITSFTLDGQVDWTRNVGAHVDGLALANDTVLAYNKDRVIGFSCKTGRVVFSFRPKYPLTQASSDVLFMRKDGGYVLWRLEKDQEDL